LRNLTEMIIWGEKHDETFMEWVLLDCECDSIDKELCCLLCCALQLFLREKRAWMSLEHSPKQ
jgi:hypothetical protein